jgi:toxin YoeB
MRCIWSSFAWEDYLYWQKVDEKTVKRMNELVKNCMRTLLDAIGKLEGLKGDLQGCWSRRITSEQRFVCKYENE